MQPLAIFEDKIIKDDKDGSVRQVSGWVGPEQGDETRMAEASSITQVTYKKYATYELFIKNGRISNWQIKFIDHGIVSVYESRSEDGARAAEFDGLTAAGLLRIAQIINAVMSSAAEYCGDRLEKQITSA